MGIVIRTTLANRSVVLIVLSGRRGSAFAKARHMLLGPSLLVEDEKIFTPRRKTMQPSPLRRQAEIYPASSATPAATHRAAIQRRRSTRSCRKILAPTALAMNVREAEAGATRLTSPQESPNSKL